MGPLSGFRIVNLRVREKVAYPDLTIDLGDLGHVVIGLENGGGKSTLLGFLIHVFLPRADRFLPRLAHRRQNKQGEEKRIEHYVPGGDPTHIIIELLVPAGSSRRHAPPSRALVGVCLHKKAGADPSVPAEEFYWSARSVTKELSLAHLALRAESGRLLDHEEWRARLNDMRKANPAAEIVIHDRQDAWDRHLRDSLKVDVEFVKTWLLSMNQDEGAADHVFTYSTSRSFLNSLITAVADPQHVAGLKTSLTTTGVDADKMRLDRRRVGLLRRLIEHTGPLAELTTQLTGIDAERDTLIDTLLAVRNRVATIESETRADVEKATGHEHEAASAAQATAAALDAATTDEIAGRLQLEQLRLDQVSRELDEHQRAQTACEQEALRAKAAALQAQLRTVRARIDDIQHTLLSQAEDAEPARRAASSALQAWRDRLEEEIGVCDTEHNLWTQRQHDADGVESDAEQRLHDAQQDIVRLDGEITRATAHLVELTELTDEAVRCGDLPQGVPAEDARDLAGQRITDLQQQVADADHRRSQHHADLEVLSERRAGVRTDLALAKGEVATRRERWEQLTARTHALTEELSASNLIELHPIQLDDHSDLIIEMLHDTSDKATARQLDAAVAAATARRAVNAIDTTHLLPPRADVVRLCELAAEAKLGTRPSWSYLARLDTDVAERLAGTHAALADGLVVNVLDDFDDVVELVRQHRNDLDGPVTIGLAEVFEDDLPAAEVAVVLPNEGFWSSQAAKDQQKDREDVCDRTQRQVDDQTALARRALQLRDKTQQWRDDIGVGGCDAASHALTAAETHLADLTTIVGELNDRCAQLAADRDDAAADAARLGAELHEQQACFERLTTLATRLGERIGIEQTRTRMETERDGARARRDSASTQRDQARADYRAAVDGATRAATTKAALGVTRNTVVKLSSTACRPGDPIDDEDVTADRQLLEQRAIARHDRWRGLVSDDQLRAEITFRQNEIVELERQCEPYDAATMDAARAMLDAEPSRSAQDFTNDAEQAQQRKEQIIKAIGGLEQTRRTQQHERDNVQRDYRHRQPHELSPDYRTENIEHTERVAQTLQAARDTAAENQRTALSHQQAAAATTQRARRWLDLATSAGTLLDNQLVPLAAPGLLVKKIDLDDRRFDLTDRADPDDIPKTLAQLLVCLTQRTEPFETAKHRVDTCATELAGDIDAMRHKLDGIEQAASQRLEQTEAVLKTADDEVAKGDKVVQTLRHLTRAELATRAILHHQDATGRLDAVAHHVANFDRRVQNLAKTTLASLRALLRAVSETVKYSQLPTTPAMGRWSGLALLKLSGMDTLNQDQQYAAILATLHHWFDPDRDDRPRFDADETVWALVEACVPRFSAKVLIPSDPLDPEHKSVETLARETSGGEGVTFALILASLLAARRASAHGHHRTTLPLDNPLSKVTKPAFLRLVRDVAHSLRVQIIALTGIRDLNALTVFPALIQLRISRRHTANVVAPLDIDDSRLQQLLRDGTLFVSPTEQHAATDDANGSPTAWPVISTAGTYWSEQIALELDSDTDGNGDAAVVDTSTGPERAE